MRETGASEVPVEIKVARIQHGDVKLRNQFITDYQPLVAKITSRFCKRYVDPSQDDEYSVALMAFNEAINQYSKDAGVTFFSFAETVIRRRLIDHLRKESRHRHLVPYSSLEVEDEDHSLVNPVEIVQSIKQYAVWGACRAPDVRCCRRTASPDGALRLDCGTNSYWRDDSGSSLCHD